jgi:hypothetical protein
MHVVLLDREVVAVDGVSFNLFRACPLGLRLQELLALHCVSRVGGITLATSGRSL